MIATLPNKHIILLIVVWSLFFMGESVLSIVSMCIIAAIISRNLLTYTHMPLEKLKHFESKLPYLSRFNSNKYLI